MPGGFLTQRDKNAAKLTTKYLIDDGSHSWRTNTPDVAAPVQPQVLDPMAREILDGSVHLDPHPDQRNTLRTKDIQDPMQAKQFMRTQITKHLEHYFASKGQPKLADKLSTDSQPPSTTISPSRISALKASPKRPPKPQVRP